MKRGFTLIEMMIVVAVLVVLMPLSFVSLAVCKLVNTVALSLAFPVLSFVRVAVLKRGFSLASVPWKPFLQNIVIQSSTGTQAIKTRSI